MSVNLPVSQSGSPSIWAPIHIERRFEYHYNAIYNHIMSSRADYYAIKIMKVKQVAFTLHEYKEFLTHQEPVETDH